MTAPTEILISLLWIIGAPTAALLAGGIVAEHLLPAVRRWWP